MHDLRSERSLVGVGLVDSGGVLELTTGDLAVHALGYVAQVSEEDLDRIDKPGYAGTTLIGKLGVESTYEAQLHGLNGYQQILVNAQGRSVKFQGPYQPNLRAGSAQRQHE